MNEELQAFARKRLIEDLAQCNISQQSTFIRMYSPKNLNLLISEVVANMPDEQLDWAMQQLSNTLKKGLIA